MPLSKDQILAADDLPFEDVPVPEWGGDVRLRMLNGAQREAIEIRLHKCRHTDVNIASQQWRGLKYLILSYAIIDDAGVQQFTDKDVQQLGEKNGSVLDRLYEFVLKQNAFSKQEAEELSKN